MINTENESVYGRSVEVDFDDPYDFSRKLDAAIWSAVAAAHTAGHGRPNLHMRIEGTELFVGYRQSDITEPARS